MIPQRTESSHYTHAPDPRAWLERFPSARRSAIANWYHYAVRNGASTPVAVAHQVRQTVQRRLQWTSAPTETAYLQAVLDALQTDRAGALAYAQSVIDYEHLPYEARQRLKAERTTPYLQEAMRGQPVTEKQVTYLRALGHTGPYPEDRAAASALIDRLKCEGGRP
jgi:hypothetical protein